MEATKVLIAVIFYVLLTAAVGQGNYKFSNRYNFIKNEDGKHDVSRDTKFEIEININVKSQFGFFTIIFIMNFQQKSNNDFVWSIESMINIDKNLYLLFFWQDLTTVMVEIPFTRLTKGQRRLSPETVTVYLELWDQNLSFQGPAKTSKV